MKVMFWTAAAAGLKPAATIPIFAGTIRNAATENVSIRVVMKINLSVPLLRHVSKANVSLKTVTILRVCAPQPKNVSCKTAYINASAPLNALTPPIVKPTERPWLTDAAVPVWYALCRRLKNVNLSNIFRPSTAKYMQCRQILTNCKRLSIMFPTAV